MRKSLLISVLVICTLGLLLNLNIFTLGEFNLTIFGNIIFAILPYLLLAILSYWFDSLWITITTGFVILSLDYAKHLLFNYNLDVLIIIVLGFTPIFLLIICIASFTFLGIIKKIKTRKFFAKEHNITIKKVFLFFVLPIVGLFMLTCISFSLTSYENPLHEAIRNQNIEEVKKLVSKKKNIDSLSYLDETPLEVAVINNYPEIVSILAEAGADINKHNLLELGVAKNANDSIRALLEAGANVNVKDNRGQTALHKVIHYKNLEGTKLILEAGANIDAKDQYGYTPLNLAASFGNIKHTKLLLDNGANINLKTNNGYTPLHDAARFGNIEIIKLLLNNNANKYAITNEGKTPEELARQNNFIEAADLIKYY